MHYYLGHVVEQAHHYVNRHPGNRDPTCPVLAPKQVDSAHDRYQTQHFNPHSAVLNRRLQFTEMIDKADCTHHYVDRRDQHDGQGTRLCHSTIKAQKACRGKLVGTKPRAFRAACRYFFSDIPFLTLRGPQIAPVEKSLAAAQSGPFPRSRSSSHDSGCPRDSRALITSSPTSGMEKPSLELRLPLIEEKGNR